MPDITDQNLAELQIQAELIVLTEHVPTVEAAAKVLGTSVDSIVKSVLFIAAGTPVLVITNGTTRIDTKKIAQHMGVSNSKVKLAKAETVLEITGYHVGGVPPVAHKTPVQVLIDQRVLGLTEVYGGGGTVETLLRIAPQEIVRATQAQVITLID